MAKKVELKERGTNETMYPVTSLDCIVDTNKNSIDITFIGDTDSTTINVIQSNSSGGYGYGSAVNYMLGEFEET